MKPFDWSFPSIYNLTEETIAMLNSPIPLLIGIRLNAKDYKAIIEKNDINMKNFIMIFLNESMIIHDQDISNYALPNKGDFIRNLKQFYYHNFNRKQSHQFKLNNESSEKPLVLKEINTEKIW